MFNIAIALVGVIVIHNDGKPDHVKQSIGATLLAVGLSRVLEDRRFQ